MNRLDFPVEIGAKVEDFTVPRKDTGRYINFSGTLIAYATSDPDEVRDRWAELRIFESTTGKYIGCSIGCSCLPGESDLIDATYATTIDGLIPFFTVDGKRTNLALSLFAQLMPQLNVGVDHV